MGRDRIEQPVLRFGSLGCFSNRCPRSSSAWSSAISPLQSGSLLPAIAFHFTHNALMICVSRIPDTWLAANEWTRVAIYQTEEGVLYRWPFAAILAVLAMLLLRWFQTQRYQPYAEESLTEVLAHEQTMPIADKPVKA